MDKNWVDKKIKEAEAMFLKIKRIFQEQEIIPPNSTERILNEIRRADYYFNFDLVVGFAYLDAVNSDNFSVEQEKLWREWIKNNDIRGMIYKYLSKDIFKRYLDSEPKEFEGDIIITDPCYIVQADNDWDACNYGSNMEILGINTYMTRDTLYGDWSCTTFNSDTKEPIGSFCADAGLVSVFLLDEVLRYNPDFDYHINRQWTTTLIKDFKGTVQFVVVHEDGYYEEETEYHKKGEYWEDYSVEVVGHGINKITGEPINFVGRQTGL